MKIFLTGGTGFVGSYFLTQALEAGHDVIALRRPGSVPRIPLKDEPRWIDGPLDGSYEEFLEGVEVFVHLASHTPNPPYDTLEQCLYWNVYTALKLTSQAIRQGVKKYVIAGSCFEYGKSSERFEYLEATTPLEPTLSYPTSKAAASIAFLGLAREKDLQLKLLRIFQVYGEGEPENRLWPSLRSAALSGSDFPMSKGGQLRDFIPVEEVAKTFMRALDFQNAKPGTPLVEHVATGHPQTVLEFSQYWWDHWKAKGQLIVGSVPYRHNEMMRVVSTNSALSKSINPMNMNQNNLKTILKEENLNLTENPRGTDKGDKKSYVEKFYESQFSVFRDEPIRLMEIGFRHGASLALWSSYFPNGKIVGLDNLSDACLQENLSINKEWLDRGNIETLIGDAYSQSFSETVPGKFDIIIDDGPHSIKSQKIAINLYLKKLNEKGLFIVEDILLGGLAIFPLMVSVPRGYIAEFYDFRMHKLSGDNCLFVIKTESSLLLVSINRLAISLKAVMYFFVEGPLRLLRKLFKIVGIF